MNSSKIQKVDKGFLINKMDNIKKNKINTFDIQLILTPQ